MEILVKLLTSAMLPTIFWFWSWTFRLWACEIYFDEVHINKDWVWLLIEHAVHMLVYKIKIGLSCGHLEQDPLFPLATNGVYRLHKTVDIPLAVYENLF